MLTWRLSAEMALFFVDNVKVLHFAGAEKFSVTFKTQNIEKSLFRRNSEGLSFILNWWDAAIWAVAVRSGHDYLEVRVS